MKVFRFYNAFKKVLFGISFLSILLIFNISDAQVTIDDIVKDHKFEHIQKHIYSITMTPVDVTWTGPKSKILIAPQYHKYWIDYYNTKNIKSLPKELHKHLNIADDVTKKLEKAIKECDKKSYEDEMTRINNTLYYLKKYRGEATTYLTKINNSYNERVGIFQELIGVNWKWEGTKKTASAAWKIKNVYQAVKTGATNNPLFAIIGTAYNVVTLGIEIDNYFVAKRYLVGALAVFKLKVLYERFIYHFLDTELSTYNALQARFGKYKNYFISKNNCAKHIVVSKKEVSKSKFGQDSWEFVWHLKDIEGVPIKLGTQVKLKRTVEYDLKQVGNSSNKFDRNETVRVGSNGELRVVWQKTNPKQKKVTFTIRDIVIPKHIYDRDGDPLSVQVDGSVKIGQLKMKALGKDKSEVGFHVGIYDGDQYVHSMNGEGLTTYDLPEGTYQLRFYFEDESVFKEDVTITNGEATLIEVSHSNTDNSVANDKVGRLNIRAYDAENNETEFFVRINDIDGAYIKSLDGKDLTETLPPMFYNLKLLIDGQDIERHVEVKENELTTLEVRLAGDTEPKTGTFISTSKRMYEPTEAVEIDFGVELSSALQNRQWQVLVSKAGSDLQSWLVMGGFNSGSMKGSDKFSNLDSGKYEARIALVVPPSAGTGFMFESILAKTGFEIIGDIADEPTTNDVPVPEGWARGTLYNSNDGSCDLQGKYLVFMNAVGGKFKNLRTGEVNQFMIVAPGSKLEVAAPSNSAFIRVFISGSADVNAREGGSISHGTLSQLADGWWYQAGCKNGTRPSSSCDNGKGQGGGTPFSCVTQGGD